MAKLSSVRDAVARMSDREKKLVFGLGLTLVVLVVVGVGYVVSTALSDAREEVEQGRLALGEIRLLAEDYLEQKGRREAVQDLISKNQVSSIVTAVNEIARGIKVESEDPRFGGDKNVSDIITSFAGKTVETRIEFTTKKKRRKRSDEAEDTTGNYEVEQSLEIAEIPIDTLYKFLEAIEGSPDLLFVRKVDISRKFGNLEHAQASITVSTIVYKEGAK